MDQNNMPNQSPALTPEQLQGLMASFQGQGAAPQSAPQAGPPGLGMDHPFIAAATGGGAPPSQPAEAPIMQRGRMGPSSNPILRLLGAVTGRGSFDYTDAPAAANQAPVAQFLSQMLGTPGAQAAQGSANNPYMSANDVAPQMGAAGLASQRNLAMFQQMAGMNSPQELVALVGKEKAIPLIMASMQKGMGGWTTKEQLGGLQTQAGQTLEQNKAVAGEAGKQTEDSKHLQFFQTQIGKLDDLLKTYKPLPMGLGGIASQVANKTGGSVGTDNTRMGAQLDNVANTLGVEINSDLARRFNLQEANALRSNMVPSSKDSPDFAQQKMRNLKDYVNAIATGNDQAIGRVKDAILGTPVGFSKPYNTGAPSANPAPIQNPHPNVGDTFHGAKVTKVTIIKKAP